jgi:isoquinoline 1-oxidoreductase beta subunit
MSKKTIDKPLNDAIEGVMLNRRAFIIASTSLTASVSFGSFAWWSRGSFSENEFNVWVSIAQDGMITIQQPAAEIGQGAMTVLPMILAEELDADWSKVKVVPSPYKRIYANPQFVSGGKPRFITANSASTSGYWDVLRRAGAQARKILIDNAARHWGLSASELTTGPSIVQHHASGRKIGYGEIATFARVPTTLPDISDNELKPPSSWRIIGTNVERVDMPSKVDGSALYGIDVKKSDMLIASVEQPPVVGGKPGKIDDSKALELQDVVAVIALDNGVAVVANNSAAALMGRGRLQIEWELPKKLASYDSEEVKRDFLELAKNENIEAGIVYTSGDFGASKKQASRIISAGYVNDHVTHACMEVMNATATPTMLGFGIDLTVPTQSRDIDMRWIAKGLMIPPIMIDVQPTLAGGGFGRRVDNSYVRDAAQIARISDRTVKVIRRFEDDIRSGTYRALTAQYLQATLDDKGNITGWSHRIVGDSVNARMFPERFEEDKRIDKTVVDGQRHYYAIPNQRLEYLYQQKGIPIGFLRGVGGGYTIWAVENFLDVIAKDIHTDPVNLRISLLAEARAKRVIEIVAEMAQWNRRRREGVGVGLAYCEYRGTHIAEVAEVDVIKGLDFRVVKMWAAADPGVAVHPGNIEAQIEGAMMMGVSLSMSEAVPIKNGKTVVSNLHDYSLMRMSDMPEIDVKIVADNKGRPAGVGEAGVPPVAPAIANAVFAATGERLTVQPFIRGKRETR